MSSVLIATNSAGDGPAYCEKFPVLVSTNWAGHYPEVSPTFVATNMHTIVATSMAGGGLTSHRKYLVPTSLWKYPVVSPLQMLTNADSMVACLAASLHPLHISMWKSLNKHVSEVRNICNVQTWTYSYLSARLHESTFFQYPAVFPFFFSFFFFKKLCSC